MTLAVEGSAHRTAKSHGRSPAWQITGIRHDPYILKHPIITVVNKDPGRLVNKGQHLFPDYEKSTSSTQQ
jgi:hypothetical protein